MPLLFFNFKFFAACILFPVLLGFHIFSMYVSLRITTHFVFVDFPEF